MSHMHSSSPPPVPLRHPVPTHPAYIPEPPSTPSSPQGYQRFSSSPGPVPPQQPLPPPHQGGAYASSSAGQGGGGYQPYVPAYAGAFGGSGMPQQQQQQYGYNQQPQGHIGPGPTGQMGGGQPGHIGGGAPGFQPNFGAWGINDASAQLGMQLGQSAVAAGQEYVQKNFATLLPQQTLKQHFNVSNSYVLSKLRLLLFPWMHKPWARRTKRVDVQGGGANHEWCTPREDVNSPDLYIPVMAIVTYILLTGLHAGINSTKGFKPQILGESASRATLVVLFDFLFVKLGCYILNIPTLAPSSSTSSFAPSSQLVDIFAYTGYKFVGVIATLSAGFLGLEGILWWAVFVYCFLGNAFFMLRSLRSLVLPDPSIAIAASSGATTATVNPAQRRRRITFLFIEACLQVVYMGALVRLG